VHDVHIAVDLRDRICVGQAAQINHSVCSSAHGVATVALGPTIAGGKIVRLLDATAPVDGSLPRHNS
jgi:hypothetical protein